jgi:Tfp pilus assembly protein PilO
MEPMSHSTRLETLSRLLTRRIEEIMNWDLIPIVFITFKLLVLGTAIFFSIKSHHDKQKEEQAEERERQNRINGA